MMDEKILHLEHRQNVIKEIESDENIKRKQESLKRHEIYKGLLEPYIYKVLGKTLEQETLDSMRVVASINPCKRIVDEESSIYTRRPDRMFHNTDEKTDLLLGNIYSLGRFNTAFKKANCILNLQEQGTMQVIPKGGKLKIKVLQPHQFDVIPDDNDPEEAAVYILSQYDKDNLLNRVDQANNRTPQSSAIEHRYRDGMDQTIADESDWRAARGTYVWWSNGYHFSTDHTGQIINAATGAPYEGDVPLEEILNPIGKNPFVDLKHDSDGEYWQRYANGTVDFSIDLAIIISDICEILGLQGFAQPIISATEPPQDLKIGPRTVLFLKKSMNAEAGEQPTFEFASPNADLSGSIEVLNALISLFLTCKGQDAGTVTSEGASAQRFTSALDRLLASIEKFEASEDDFELFKWVENEVFELIKLWLEAFSGVTKGGLVQELSGIIPSDVSFDVQFEKPNTEISDKERYEFLRMKVDDGTMSMVELIMKDRGVDEDKAREIIENISDEKQLALDKLKLNSETEVVEEDEDMEEDTGGEESPTED